jgi:hypothetical protein
MATLQSDPLHAPLKPTAAPVCMLAEALHAAGVTPPPPPSEAATDGSRCLLVRQASDEHTLLKHATALLLQNHSCRLIQWHTCRFIPPPQANSRSAAVHTTLQAVRAPSGCSTSRLQGKAAVSSMHQAALRSEQALPRPQPSAPPAATPLGRSALVPSSLLARVRPLLA